MKRPPKAPTGEPRIERVALSKLAKWPKNPKGHDMAFLGEAFAVNGFAEFPTVDEGTGKIVAGNGRVEKLEQMKAAGEAPPARVEVRKGEWFVPTIRGMTFPAPGKHVLASNRGVELGGWTKDLADALARIGADDLLGTGYTQDDFAAFMTEGGGAAGGGAGSLAGKFLVPPFSVLDARQGYWQDRKRAWLALGIQSELGRGGDPGGSPRDAANYGRTKARGDGAGREIRAAAQPRSRAAA